ncbi:hypothetical protein FHU14_004827 [Mesorhizobium sp. RMAD-H1]|nr:hypothetical protein [Mesorhizobium sp. RMAD-H1]
MKVLRFELMINVVCMVQPQASKGEAQHETLCSIGCRVERDRCVHRRRNRQDLPRGEGAKPSAQDLARALKDPAWHLERVGLEAGPLSQWLFEGLAHRPTCR